MGELITINKKDPTFNKYIWGTFSDQHKAIPVETLNVSTDSEQVTFEIKNNSEIQTPFFIFKWAQIFKLKNIIWVLLPLYLILIKNILDATLEDPLLALSSALGALSLHIAMNLRNDIQDHVRGLDRINPTAGSRALQNGWVTANQLKNISYFFIFFGFVLGLPSIILFPQILWLVTPLMILGILGLAVYDLGLKYRAWSELVVFLMLGPFLAVGYQMSFGGELDTEAVFIGILTGWLAVYTLHMKNFDQLLVGSKAEFNNTVTRLGFENSKRLLNFWWIAFVGLFVTYHGIYTSNLWMWMTSVFVVLFSLPLIAAVAQIESPIGSKAERAVSISSRTVQLVLGIWILENAWYYFLWEVW